jgi:Protein-L-isoaspartate(D-aspartate) O-methyltransferase (PCMT)
VVQPGADLADTPPHRASGTAACSTPFASSSRLARGSATNGAHLARFVWSVERLPDLAAAARGNLAAAGIVTADVVTGDGSQVLPEHAPFRRIVVAVACPQVASPLVEQLAHGDEEWSC